MKSRGAWVLRLAVFIIQITQVQAAHGSEINMDVEASALKSGYGIRLLQPLPRRNSGCETIFRNGKVLETCDPNYGFNPENEGVFRAFCEWSLNTHYQKNNSSPWLDSYFNPDMIRITNAKVGYYYHQRTLIQRMRSVGYIVYRWIQLDFSDGITGSKLGSLKCYPSKFTNYTFKEELVGTGYYLTNRSKEVNDHRIKSGLSIGDVAEHLDGYAEIIPLK